MSDTVSEVPSQTKVCPSCAETVRAAAKMCRYCGHHFDDGVTTTSLTLAPARSGSIVATVAGALLIVGSVLPWASVHVLGHVLRRGGLEYRSGIFTLVLGTLTLVVGVAGLARLRLPNLTGVATIAAGAIAAILGVWEFARISTRLDTLRALAGRIGPERFAGRFGTGHVGIGLWGVIAGAVLAMVAGFVIQKAAAQDPSTSLRAESDQPAPVSA
jgi:Uncharacterised protein family UPF0547